VVESCRQGELPRPKSGRACTVLMVEQVDEALSGYMDLSALRRG
jgi:hypothetical protein